MNYMKVSGDSKQAESSETQIRHRNMIRRRAGPPQTRCGGTSPHSRRLGYQDDLAPGQNFFHLLALFLLAA